MTTLIEARAQRIYVRDAQGSHAAAIMKDAMEHPLPQPPRLGEHDGLAYALFLPPGAAKCGVVILHGAGSSKESHFDFARGCRADGIAALAFDARGHGRSSGEFGPRAIDDALAMVGLLHHHVDRVGLRGSSMGGFQAIHAAAADDSLSSVVAICPAPEDSLRRMLRTDEPLRFRCDVPATERWLESLDIYEAATRLGPRTALLLLHARGDEQIPWTVSEELHAAAHEPKRLLVLPGGHHRSLQHDLEVQALSRRWILQAA
jgi:pimeloyl-ACP methyl ester carboxylesterase